MIEIPSTGQVLMVETRDAGAVGTIDECIHTGWLAWVNHHGQPYYTSPQTPPVWLRSTAKPFQAIPFVAALHQTGRLSDATDAMLAVACASHVGSPVHQQAVQALLGLGGLQETALGCGVHPPLDKPTRRKVQAARVNAEQHGHAPPAYALLGHNCSGNHAGQLVASVLNRWPLAGYKQTTHPVQQAFAQQVSQVLGANAVQGVGVDGCGIPTVAMGLAELARLYAGMEGYSPHMPRLLAAITNQPNLFGGSNRVDSAIVAASEGQLIAKVGADGVMAVCHRQLQQGLAIKVAHGGERPRNTTLVAVLQHMGWLTPAQCQHPVLAKLLSPTRKNGHGTAVGTIHYPCLANL